MRCLKILLFVIEKKKDVTAYMVIGEWRMATSQWETQCNVNSKFEKEKKKKKREKSEPRKAINNLMFYVHITCDTNRFDDLRKILHKGT